MKRHMTDEGWQLFAGLEGAGYTLFGHNLENPTTDVQEIVDQYSPSVVVLQDKREWDLRPGDFRDPLSQFKNVECLSSRPDIFKLTVLKDCHQRPRYHKASAAEIGCHAWVVYYSPKIVQYLTGYVRPEHLVRTYHSLDPNVVPQYTDHRPFGCLISGATSRVYPLRQRLIQEHRIIPGASCIRHPGYHRRGCATALYLKLLSQFKVAVCTSSIYGYALRKIVEATAAGCKVITDLPTDEVLPYIDDNLIRVHPHTKTITIATIVQRCYDEYNHAQQEHFARLTTHHYSYKVLGAKLAQDIEDLRNTYSPQSC